LTGVKAAAPPFSQVRRVTTTTTICSAPPASVPGATKVSASAVHFTKPRLAREFATVGAMLRIYCQGQHGGGQGLCAECRSLLDYAAVRLDRCQFGAEKPTCVKCPVHCYQRARREQMRAVMRFAGPRMLYRHPWLSARHWLDGFRPVPAVR